MQILPLRNFLVLQFDPEMRDGSKLYVVKGDRLVRPATVTAVGPECRDIAVGARVLVNFLACHAVNGKHLVAETAVLATL